MERIIIVDENDNCIGEEDKEKCHDGDGILHRAFLAMVFTGSGDLLLTRRSDEKRLWPGFWDGSVASHVFRDESYEEASKRRLMQELGLITDNIRYLFKFRYKVGYENIGTENEICAVTAVNGIEPHEIFPDRKEISEVKKVNFQLLSDEIRLNGKEYTPWLILALEHMSRPENKGAENLFTSFSLEKTP